MKGCEIMKLSLDDSADIGILSEKRWGEYFAIWFDRIVEILGKRHERFDREDAVMQAFAKLMARGVEWKGAPRSEKDLFGCVLWQARGALSHSYEKKDIEIRHAKNAVVEGFVGAGTLSYCRMDEEIRYAAAFAAFHELCDEAGMKPRNVDAYCRCYLFGEATDVVAKELGMTANNIHQIKSRIERLLAAKGRKCYLKHRQRLFRDAA